MKIWLALALACAAATPWEPAAKPPKGWSAGRGDGESTVLRGPKGELPLVPMISIIRYVDGDAQFKDAAAYLKTQSEPGIAHVKGEKSAVADRVKVGARSFARVARWSTEFVPPGSMNGLEVRVREEHVVVPAKGGFFALVYAAPEKGFEKNRPAFQRVLESFAARQPR
jgi:hypothetical protein